MSKEVRPGRPLRGEVAVPGDKSISHRALILGALAEGRTSITGLSPGADVRSTLSCLRRLGVEAGMHEMRGQSIATVEGVGLRGFKAPAAGLDCGNSGTTIRLLMGVLAGQEFSTRLDGDDSLRRRPMARVAEPLSRMGASFDLSQGGRAPLSVRGGALKAIAFKSPVASAQLKSAVLLAGLLAEGETAVSEPTLSRDHTERMLPAFGAALKREGLTVSLRGGQRLRAAAVRVPGDPSSAAFWAVAAALVEGSELRLSEVGLNPTRAGFLEVLKRMGAIVRTERWPDGMVGVTEPVGDLMVWPGALSATDIAADEVPGLIDEVPILALAATQAKGKSRFRGLSELRHKESDRLKEVAALLRKFGGKARVSGDDLVVEGPSKLKGARIVARGDHRLALTAMVAGLVASGKTVIADAECADVSYPSFYGELQGLAGF